MSHFFINLSAVSKTILEYVGQEAALKSMKKRIFLILG